MALLCFQPGIDSRGTVAPCQAGMVGENNALNIRCTLFRRPMPNRGKKHTAKYEYGTEVGSQSDKKAERENSIKTRHIKNHV